MKAAIFNGSVKEDTFIKTIQQIIQDSLDKAGYDTNVFMLHKSEIAPCLGCFGCWMKTPGICVINDAGRETARAFVQSDLVVFLTPVTFGGYSSALKKAVDRLIPVVLPHFMKINGETHHKYRYKKYPVLVIIGTLDRADSESGQIFRTLAGRNAINMHSPSHTPIIIFKGEETADIEEKIREHFVRMWVIK